MEKKMKCGLLNPNDVAAKFIGNNKLQIEGTGAMANFELDGAPWISLEQPDIITEVAIIQKGVTTIGDFAFGNCSFLRNVWLPEGITKIGDSAFYLCISLSRISNIEKIGDMKKIREEHPISSEEGVFIIPDSVRSIGTRAFYGCDTLKEVTIGANVTSIGHHAFAKCEHLISFTNKCPKPQAIDEVFNGIDLKQAKLFVPKGAKENYQDIDGWKDFGEVCEIGL